MTFLIIYLNNIISEDVPVLFLRLMVILCRLCFYDIKKTLVELFVEFSSNLSEIFQHLTRKKNSLLLMTFLPTTRCYDPLFSHGEEENQIKQKEKRNKFTATVKRGKNLSFHLPKFAFLRFLHRRQCNDRRNLIFSYRRLSFEVLLTTENCY